MTEQLDLLGGTRIIELTDRQQYALEHLERLDGAPADELGALMHSRRGRHNAGVRCAWCQSEGQSVLLELRRKGLVVRKRGGVWRSLRPSGEGAHGRVDPTDTGSATTGSPAAVGTAGAAAPSPDGYDPATAEIPF